MHITDVVGDAMRCVIPDCGNAARQRDDWR